jgi:hypothetical protein
LHWDHKSIVKQSHNALIAGVYSGTMKLVASLLALASALPREALPKYKDPTLPVNVRVASLLAEMTLEEKVAQLLNPWPQGLTVDEIIAQYGKT